jgi:outer membrane biosynthesis protein TonB
VNSRNIKILFVVAVICIFGKTSFAQVSAGGAIMAVDERNLGAVAGRKIDSPVSAASAKTGQTKTKKTSRGKKSAPSKPVQTESPSVARTTYKKATPKPPTPKKFDGFVIGDKYTFFNFEITEFVQPIHTIAAQNAGAKGLVQVEILIGEKGNVLQARARTGNKLLHPEAEKAALMTKFNQPSVYGKPARAIGFIVFRFGARED